MDSRDLYLLVADAILVTHALFIAFVVFGLLLILAGRAFGWSWVRNPWFRLAHLAAIGFVALQAWLGVICPLTVWEMTLREKGGGDVYEGTFVSHWVQKIVYYHAPDWVFIVCYTVFAALVLASWVWVRPRSFKKAGNLSIKE